MKLNVEEFRKIVHAATANYLIPSLHLQFKMNNVLSVMKSNDGVLTKINTPNSILEGMEDHDDAIDMYFNDIKTTILPYLALLKDETMEIEIVENGFILKDKKRKIKICFCDSSVVNIATKSNSNVKFDIKFDYDAIDEAYADIRKIAPRFGKIYFGAKKGVFYLETKDGTKYSNSFRADVAEFKGDEFECCFNYKVFHSVFTSLGDGDGFLFNMKYFKDRDAGFMLWSQITGDFYKEYFIVSKTTD
jgi:hypothetical protein